MLDVQSESFKKFTAGDFSDIIAKVLNPKIAISAPVFFANNGGPGTAILDTIAAVSFGFTGIGYAPCAIPITPLGVGVFPQGINIQPEFFNIAPTGASQQPFPSS